MDQFSGIRVRQYEAEVRVQPVSKIGGHVETHDWCDNLNGQPVHVVGKDGVTHTIGYVTQFEIRSREW